MSATCSLISGTQPTASRDSAPRRTAPTSRGCWRSNFIVFSLPHYSDRHANTSILPEVILNTVSPTDGNQGDQPCQDPPTHTGGPGPSLLGTSSMGSSDHPAGNTLIM